MPNEDQSVENDTLEFSKLCISQQYWCKLLVKFEIKISPYVFFFFFFLHIRPYV